MVREKLLCDTTGAGGTYDFTSQWDKDVGYFRFTYGFWPGQIAHDKHYTLDLTNVEINVGMTYIIANEPVGGPQNCDVTIRYREILPDKVAYRSITLEKGNYVRLTGFIKKGDLGSDTWMIFCETNVNKGKKKVQHFWANDNANYFNELDDDTEICVFFSNKQKCAEKPVISFFPYSTSDLNNFEYYKLFDARTITFAITTTLFAPIYIHPYCGGCTLSTTVDRLLGARFSWIGGGTLYEPLTGFQGLFTYPDIPSDIIGVE